jgi:hypothetical protein
MLICGKLNIGIICNGTCYGQFFENVKGGLFNTKFSIFVFLISALKH